MFLPALNPFWNCSCKLISSKVPACILFISILQIKLDKYIVQPEKWEVSEKCAHINFNLFNMLKLTGICPVKLLKLKSL